jgi:hypothetical protein
LFQLDDLARLGTRWTRRTILHISDCRTSRLGLLGSVRNNS